jgi:hypothetical protein
MMMAYERRGMDLPKEVMDMHINYLYEGVKNWVARMNADWE